MGVARHRGFTLIELITVIVLLGALSLVLFPRLMDSTALDAVGLEQELKAGLRHARSLAAASGCPVRFRVDASGYGVYRQSDGAGTSCGSSGEFSVLVAHPARPGGFQGTIPGGVSVSAFATTFDALGRASSGGMLSVGARTVTVVADTGYAY